MLSAARETVSNPRLFAKQSAKVTTTRFEPCKQGFLQSLHIEKGFLAHLSCAAVCSLSCHIIISKQLAVAWYSSIRVGDLLVRCCCQAACADQLGPRR